MSEAATTPAAPSASSFLRSRLGSILAVMPLGVWTVIHIWNNLAAFDGEAAWRASVTEYRHPIAQLATALVVLLPLLLHVLWGLGRMLWAKPNNSSYGYFGNLNFLLQRLSALGVLAFIGAHLWLAFVHPRIVEGHAESFADIAHQMHHHVPTLVVYLLGTLGVAYHLANGIFGVAMGWGLVTSRKSLSRMSAASVGCFLVLLALAWSAIYALYRAGA
jgi:succinate dehydrogenase / fumarate reductase cytochrome b subunit